MEVILLKDIDKVGRKGDVVRVRDGYARNFLFPRTLALASTRANRQFVEEQRERSAKKRAKEKNQAEEFAGKLKSLKLKIDAKAGEKGKLFGSVTAQDVVEALGRQGYQFTKKQIELREAIHALGTYAVNIEIYPQVKATINVEVVQQQ
ncbi:MAG: 50S ribosomal protein L9 [Candidatus Omnitrophica bacterium]|nr:50S ribosomal protein L9 [Candidatus Omnitrophota bacterium]